MSDESASAEPDWDVPLALTLTPALVSHALLATATAVHTGRESCIDEGLVLSSLVALDEASNHYIRLVEQEFYEETEPEAVWHDWTVEIRIGAVLTTGHWQVPAGGPPGEWAWHAREAERAFERACVLIGRRVSRGLSIVEPEPAPVPVRSTRH